MAGNAGRAGCLDGCLWRRLAYLRRRRNRGAGRHSGVGSPWGRNASVGIGWWRELLLSRGRGFGSPRDGFPNLLNHAADAMSKQPKGVCLRRWAGLRAEELTRLRERLTSGG